MHCLYAYMRYSLVSYFLQLAFIVHDHDVKKLVYSLKFEALSVREQDLSSISADLFQVNPPPPPPPPLKSRSLFGSITLLYLRTTCI